MFGFIEKIFIGSLNVYIVGSCYESLPSNSKETINFVSLNHATLDQYWLI